MSGLLDAAHFETNFEAIRSDYEATVLRIGKFDELTFLDQSNDNQIWSTAKDLDLQHLGSRQGTLLMPQTPMSGKRFFVPQEKLNVTPVSKATLVVAWLLRLIGNREPGPSQNLTELFMMCQVT